MTLILYIRRLSYYIISMLIAIYITEPRDILFECRDKLHLLFYVIHLYFYTYLYQFLLYMGYVRNQMKCFCYRDVLFDSPTFTAISEDIMVLGNVFLQIIRNIGRWFPSNRTHFPVYWFTNLIVLIFAKNTRMTGIKKAKMHFE